MVIRAKKREWEVAASMNGVSFGGDENVLELGGAGGYTVCEHTTNP